ncbi:protoglobin family protein [Paludisphaera mucosa]|uniref:Protoglobin family protein n=1 Tax=Paludisphaera mucosa TaxID=3030827 RepID=A0ABT6FB28_9BACT|nr:protoglobin family protein [Paludisphaera mucosa]
MKHIDEKRLEADVEYRFQYVAEYIGFGPGDERAIREAAALTLPLVPRLVDEVYDAFHRFDATWRHFLSRQQGKADFGTSLDRRLQELTPEHAMVKTRKHSLGRYFVRLMSEPFDAAMIQYMDAMGRIHNAESHRSRLDVPLVQMNAFLGQLADVIFGLIRGLGLEPDREFALIRAYSKVLWLQNDLVARHYLRLAGS